MNTEESIEILKNMILMPDGWIIGKNYKGNLEFIGCPEGQEAIETLLTAYKKEKEKNNKYWTLYCKERDDKVFNYTSNDKIKAKIEEYEKNKKILEERKNGVFYSLEEMNRVDRNIKFYDAMIEEMQSLLEKE